MWGSANFTRSAAAGSQAAAGPGTPDAAGGGDGHGGGPESQPGDDDGVGDPDADHHATFIHDESGEEEEVDQETGELKGAAA
jgi:single-strand DNA-binding protein